MTDTVGNIFRTIFIFLDDKIYWLVNQAYFLFNALAEATIFTTDQIQGFSSRIYVLISIIMLFKLAFAFITYIVNPDSIKDKEKGAGKLVKNIVVCIVLLASVPTIFNEAYHLQQIIFKNQVIQKILTGNDVEAESDADTSKALSTYLFLSFFRPTTKIAACINYSGIGISDECVAALNAYDTSKNVGTAYYQALSTYDISLLMDSSVFNLRGGPFVTSSGDFYSNEYAYIFDYNYGISTAVGLFTAWILIGFCLDLAVRTVKLGFLQIIAPIPILLSLTPGKKNNLLSNWAKECVDTWASLFVRIGIIAFALALIVTINSGDGIFSLVSGNGNNYFMVTVFITLGLLLFAKEVPKLIEDLLGIKSSGKITFNAFKKLGETPLVGGALTAGATFAGGAALAGGRMAFGAARSLASGAKGALKSGESFGENFNKQWSTTKARGEARIGAAGESAKEKLTSAGLGGTDKLGGSMHKSYATRFKDYKPEDKMHKEGKKLVDKAVYQAGDKTPDGRTLTADSKEVKDGEINDTRKYGLFKDRALVESMKDMDSAKKRRDEISGNYEKAKLEFDATGGLTVRENLSGEAASNYISENELRLRDMSDSYASTGKVTINGKEYSGNEAKTYLSKYDKLHEQMVKDYNSGNKVNVERTVSGQEAASRVEAMRVEDKKASSHYDKLKATFESTLKTSSKADADKYKAYSAEEDAHTAKLKVKQWLDEGNSSNSGSDIGNASRNIGQGNSSSSNPSMNSSGGQSWGDIDDRM